MAVNKDVTVMGPGGSDAPGDILTAPRLSSKTDKFVYRRKVRMWCDVVQSSAESGYTKAKATAENLGHTLFSSMDPMIQDIFTSAIDAGRLAMRRHRNGDKFSDKDHAQCVEKILNLVAKESSTERVKRLIKMLTRVQECKRKPSETYQEYSYRYESLARVYLSQAKIPENTQEEQSLAITAIENAGLPTDTYNSIINRLVGQAKMNPCKPRSSVPTTLLKEMVEIIRNQHQMLSIVTDNAISKEDANKLLKDVKIINQSLSEKANDVDMPPDDELNSDVKEVYFVGLTKALEELQELKTDNQRKDEIKGETTNNDNRTKDATKQMGTMMSGTRDDARGPENAYKGRKPRYDRQRGKQGYRRGQGRYPRKRTSYYRSDRERDGSLYSSEEEDDRNDNKKRRNVKDRLGRKQEEEHPNKRVRFEYEKIKNSRGKGYSSENEYDSDNDSYFGKGDRLRS